MSIDVVTLAALLLVQPSPGQGQSPAPAAAQAARPAMVTYQLVILRKGPSHAITAGPEGQRVFREHVAFMYKLGAAGTSAVAGPVLNGGDLQGLMLLKVATAEEAHRIVSADPAVASGIFVHEIASVLSPEGRFGKWAEPGTFETVYFGFLNSGPDRGHDADTAKRLQAEHLAYMAGQAKEGALVVAGPFTTAGTRRGMVVYRVSDLAEARRRAEGDPAVTAGRLIVELHTWQVPLGALPADAR